MNIHNIVPSLAVLRSQYFIKASLQISRHTQRLFFFCICLQAVQCSIHGKMFYFWKARGEAVDLRFYIAVASIKHVFSCEYVQLLLEKVLNSPAISFQAKWPIQRHEPFHLYNVCALHSQALVWKLGTLLWQLKASIASCVINAFFQGSETLFTYT